MQTSSRIRVLSDQTINKIAAGEVIENPASVVKELVENSLDAGSETICVEIQEGGRQLIRITDDGCGMSSDDALLSLERHATSKIREVEDIEDLLTMGFRGEAIPSIAAISKFKLLTAPRTKNGSAENGSLIIVEGGRLISHSAAACSPGTTIEVKNLFFNVPVRRKFQKSPAYDTQEILKILSFLALAHPTIQFELISDQKSLLKTPVNSSEISFHDRLKKRLECIFGQEFTKELIPLNFERGPYQLKGFIGSSSLHKPNRTGHHLFINQRSVSSPLIAASIREGYGTMLPNHRYPIFILHLRMPGALLDVNVHPQKKEVRIRQEFQLKEALIQSVQNTLRGEHKSVHFFEENSVPTSSTYWIPPATSFKMAEKPEGNWVYQTSAPLLEEQLHEPQHPLEQKITSDFDSKETENSNRNSSVSNPTDFSPFPDSFLSPSELTSSIPIPKVTPTILATLSGYCILDPFQLLSWGFETFKDKRSGGLALLDQRAAYSRIHYEQLLQNSSKQESQGLLIPITLQLSSQEFQAMQEYAPLLNRMGFSVREFGERTFLIDAAPPFFKKDQLQNCLSLLLQDLVEMQTSRRVQIQKEEQLALAACRASLPTARQLSTEEAKGLIQQLFLCKIPFKCPMGKPTCIYVSPDEITKWFKA